MKILPRDDFTSPFWQYLDEALQAAWNKRRELKGKVLKAENPYPTVTIKYPDYLKAREDYLFHLGKSIGEITVQEFFEMDRAICDKVGKESPKKVGLYYMVNAMLKSMREAASPKNREKYLPWRLPHGWKDRAAPIIGRINQKILRLQEAKLISLEAAQILETEGPFPRKREDLRLIWNKAITLLKDKLISQSSTSGHDIMFEKWYQHLPDDFRLPRGRPRPRKKTE